MERSSNEKWMENHCMSEYDNSERAYMPIDGAYYQRLVAQ